MNENYNIYKVAVIVTFLFINIPCFSQWTHIKKEEQKQSIVEKYSSYLTGENEILSLRTANSRHYKLKDDVYLAKIFSRPINSENNEKSFYKIETDTTLGAPVSGKIFKDGTNFTRFDNTLRIQNTDDYGCENGYRSWVKYDISSIPNTANVVEIHQYIYCTELVEGFFDYLNYNIVRVDSDPVNAAPEDLWTDIYEGAMYEYNEWVTNPPGWEWCILNSPAPMDFTSALNNEDWFALGYMVKCDEDDADYRAVFDGYLDPHPPYLVVTYSVSTGIRNIVTNPVSFRLYQNYPNPFNPVTKIRYELPRISYVHLRVFDVLGREVKILANGEQNPGIHEVEFNGAGLPSGFYFYILQTGEFSETKKMILLK